jgi:hypothetical protein
MELHNAMQLLKLDTYLFTQMDLKKAYFKHAIKCHPDKNANSVNSTLEFQNLKDAYDKLLPYAVQPESNMSYSYETDMNNSTDAINIPLDIIIQLGKSLLSNKVISFNNIGNLFDLLISIYTKTDVTASIKLDMLSHTITENIYNWLLTYTQTYKGQYINIYTKLLDNLQTVLKENVQNNTVITRIFNTTIDDLLNDNIYKLVIDNKTFLVPCWYPESVYDLNNSGLLVTCIPTLESNMYLDNSYNLHVSLKIPFTKIKLTENLLIYIGKKQYTIYTNQLVITNQQQTICLFNSGILLITDDDFYKSTSRSTIYLYITLV